MLTGLRDSGEAAASHGLDLTNLLLLRKQNKFYTVPSSEQMITLTFFWRNFWFEK